MTEKAYRYCQCLVNANKDILEYRRIGIEKHCDGFVFQNAVAYSNNLIWSYAGIEKEDLLINALAVFSGKYTWGEVCFLDTFSHTIIDKGGEFQILDFKFPLPADVKPANSIMRVVLCDEAALRATIHFDSLSHDTVK